MVMVLTDNITESYAVCKQKKWTAEACPLLSL